MKPLYQKTVESKETFPPENHGVQVVTQVRLFITKQILLNNYKTFLGSNIKKDL